MLLKKKGLSADLSLLEQPILVIKVKFWHSTLSNYLAQHHSLLCTIIISTERQGFKARSNHPLLEAFTEYNRLVKARYLLSYIDDSALHSHVQKALNRGEACHQLRRAISQVNGDRFRGNSDEEIELWNECARLMANAIIYFNSKVLSNLLESFEH